MLIKTSFFLIGKVFIIIYCLQLCTTCTGLQFTTNSSQIQKSFTNNTTEKVKKKKILLRFHCLWQFHKIFTVSHCRNESKCCIINPSFLFFSQAFETNLSDVNTSKLNKLPFDHLYTRALLSSHLIENWHHVQNDRKRDYCREYCICQPQRYLARRAAYDWTYDSGRFFV